MQAASFFERLWSQYVEMAPAAQRIHDHIETNFGRIYNDHVAFRTYDRPGYAIADLEPAFLQMGYQRAESYDFGDKHLAAYAYLPPSDELPRIFLSQLLSGKFSTELQNTLSELLSDPSHARGQPAERLLQGRAWPMPSVAQYQLLLKESAYAAWLSVWGLCANHFTVAVHQLQPNTTLEQVVASVQTAGFAMNEAGGLIKGTAQELLEQASTLADICSVELQGELHKVGSCYYEFARRHCNAQGQLYQGFVAASANHIFESTSIDSEASSKPHGKAESQ